MSKPAHLPTHVGLPFRFSVVDGVLYVDVDTDVVFRYHGSHTELIEGDQSVALGGTYTAFAGGVMQCQPYDPKTLMEGFGGKMNPETLAQMVNIGARRASSEAAKSKQDARRRFYYEAAERQKYNQRLRKGCKCGR